MDLAEKLARNYQLALLPAFHLDIDRFTRVNDVHGHAGGLKELAAHLTASLLHALYAPDRRMAPKLRGLLEKFSERQAER